MLQQYITERLKKYGGKSSVLSKFIHVALRMVINDGIETCVWELLLVNWIILKNLGVDVLWLSPVYDSPKHITDRY